MGKKIAWVKFWTRNFGLFRYYVYIESNTLPFYKQHFGDFFHYALTVPDGKLMAYYHDLEELKNMTERMYQTACRDYVTFQKYSNQIFYWMEDFIRYNRSLNKKTLPRRTSQLVTIYDRWYKKYLYWQIGIYFYFVLEPIVTEKFHQAMEGKPQQLIDSIMQPEKMNAITLEEFEALKVAMMIKKNPHQTEKLIRKHYKKFLWIPCYDIHHSEYTLDYFQERFAKLLKLSPEQLAQKSEVLHHSFQVRKDHFKAVLKTLGSAVKDVAQIMHVLVFYKDHRDDLRRKTGFVGKPFMRHFSGRLGLTLEEVNFLTPLEVRSGLLGRKIDRKMIHHRIPSHYVLLLKKRKIQLFIDSEVQDIMKQELPEGEQNESEFITGVIASKGRTSGRVVIVRHNLALSRVKKGDVIVALTTHPDYVPTMKKASAIITDEGGTTSHAAIVSRELNIPCLVGTKVATNFFKDGDRVEVDADKGFVRKIL